MSYVQVWRDFKCKLKKKLTNNKAELNATGGGLCKLLPLSPLEEAASNLLQFEKQFNPEGVAQGIQQSNDETSHENIATIEQIICEDFSEVPSTSACAIEMLEQPTSRKRKSNDQRKEFFEKHNSMQKEVFNAISKTISEVKDCLIEISQHQKKICDDKKKTLEEIKTVLKETSRYQRKLYEVEEKK